MSHGQATRSTLTFSRVIHFITVLLVLLFFPLLPARCTPSSALAPLHAVSYSAAAPSSQFWRGGRARCPGSWFGCGLCSGRLLSLGGGGPSPIFPARPGAPVRPSFRAPCRTGIQPVINRRANPPGAGKVG